MVEVAASRSRVSDAHREATAIAALEVAGGGVRRWTGKGTSRDARLALRALLIALQVFMGAVGCAAGDGTLAVPARLAVRSGAAARLSRASALVWLPGCQAALIHRAKFGKNPR